MSDSISIEVNYNVEGFHCWPEAHAPRDYLRNRHRHQFFFTVSMLAHHEEREVELHDLRDFCLSKWNSEQGSNSCETMARELAQELKEEFGVDRIYSVRVMEDGECGARVTTGRLAHVEAFSKL